MLQNKSSAPRFDEMNLCPAVFNALQTIGYDHPTPIQTMTIPHMMKNKDILGQARTGTGKTAAFALPLLSQIDLDSRRPQVLVLTPTRELAIQVAESFQTYGAQMKGLNVLAVYGGQSYGVQLNQIRRGVHVVVGTPGRLMDHMRRKTISFADLSSVVLDEADEMLHMGFIDDIEWILNKTPNSVRTALFSATMPTPIRKMAGKYLTDPEQIIVQPDTDVASTISQTCWLIKGARKKEALARILEAADFDGVIVFTKTKKNTVDVANSLEKKGFRAEALNGDMAQAARERTVNRLKNSHIDILVATDVAARGLDVDRISHVINYDMPSKTEQYIHRIGRTGRAGRAGEAILFVGRNERWMLRHIERVTRQKVTQIELPTNSDINQKRIADFKNRVIQTAESQNLDFFSGMVESIAQEKNIPVVQVAAALACLSHGKRSFLLPESTRNGSARITMPRSRSSEQKKPAPKHTCIKQQKRVQPEKESSRHVSSVKDSGRNSLKRVPVKKGMERYRIEVGQKHGLCPGDVVGAISNETGLESRYIGSINIDHDCAFVDLPFGMPKTVFSLLKNTWVRSQKMSISKVAC
jgi:ATP-dependent RNA helicase DeaD